MSNKSLSRRQFLRGAAVVGAGVPFLQACGSGPPAAEDSDSGAEAAAPSMEMTTVRYAQVIGPLDKQVDMFNEQSDTVHVEFELVPWGEHADKLLIDVAAGTAPDLWFIGGPWWTQIKRKKVALSISEFLANDPDVVMDDFEIPGRQRLGHGRRRTYTACRQTRLSCGVSPIARSALKRPAFDLPNENWTFADVAAAGPKLNRGEESYSIARTAPRRRPLSHDHLAKWRPDHQRRRNQVLARPARSRRSDRAARRLDRIFDETRPAWRTRRLSHCQR